MSPIHRKNAGGTNEKRISKFPDKSEFSKGYDFGYRAGVRDMEDKIENYEVNGMRKTLLMLLYILRSKYHSSDEDLKQLAEDIHDYARYVAEGKVTLEALENELINVYSVEF